MKKYSIFLLLAALLLSGCGNTTATEPTTAPAEALSEAPTVPATEAPSRPAQFEIEFMLEGMSEKQPATLYIGQGYSIYIPDGDYEMAEDGHWVAAQNDQVGFEVVFYPGVTEEDIQNAITPAPLTRGDDGRWFMSRQDGSNWDSPCLDVWLHPAEDGVYAFFSRYFLEAAEGFGARMSVIASTFEITE